jgi:hypothetical protein
MLWWLIIDGGLIATKRRWGVHLGQRVLRVQNSDLIGYEPWNAPLRRQVSTSISISDNDSSNYHHDDYDNNNNDDNNRSLPLLSGHEIELSDADFQLTAHNHIMLSSPTSLDDDDAHAHGYSHGYPTAPTARYIRLDASTESSNSSSSSTSSSLSPGHTDQVIMPPSSSSSSTTTMTSPSSSLRSMVSSPNQRRAGMR